MSIRPIEITDLEKRAANVYEAIVILSKRARQVNEEQKIEFNQRVEILNAKMKIDDDGTSEVETPPHPDQILVGREFERKYKPSEKAIDDFLFDKLSYHYEEKPTETISSE
ncbi:MAG: hypothetical protein FJ218_09975 [Ignavibacteria bacterium]|nr:hypothetical protein [Ignavibacteria bacterium]